jgi:phosphatidylinositol glycan class O
MKIRAGLVILVFELVGLYLFKEGFLLSRLELENISAPQETFKRFNKTLLIIIDALRFDFIEYLPQETNPPHYINKLPVIHELLQTQKFNSLLFRAMADPPTTTLQRLMGITTGGLPTLVDAGSNFASSAVTEDNFVAKLLAKGTKVTFFGDDTWGKLFSNLSLEKDPEYKSKC